MRQVEGISILSEQLLFNAKRAIMQIYYGKNKTRFDDDDDDDDDDKTTMITMMMMIIALY
jgi:hypothetical protein